MSPSNSFVKLWYVNPYWVDFCMHEELQVKKRPTWCYRLSNSEHYSLGPKLPFHPTWDEEWIHCGCGGLFKQSHWWRCFLITFNLPLSYWYMFWMCFKHMTSMHKNYKLMRKKIYKISMTKSWDAKFMVYKMNFYFNFIQIYDIMNTSFHLLFKNHGHLKINANIFFLYHW